MYKLIKVVNIWDEFDCGEFETQEKAFKKMKSLIKKEVGQTNYIREIKESDNTLLYDYGMYNRYYRIEGVKNDNLL